MTPQDGKPAAGAEAGGQDGSMEDILASIRRILAEDSAQPMPPPPEPATPPGDEVLDLTEQMLAPETTPPPAAPPPAAPPPSATGTGMSASDIDALFDAPPQAAAAEAAPMSAADIDALFSAPPEAKAPEVKPPAMPAPPMATAAPAWPQATPAAPGDGLIGGTVAAAAAASFAALRAAARGPAAEARPAAADVLLGNGAVTLEQIVRDELRPLLKAWLDANLPPLVERLVKAELERVARG
jgi:cell pole-organizing protein PopZ